MIDVYLERVDAVELSAKALHRLADLVVACHSARGDQARSIAYFAAGALMGPAHIKAVAIRRDGRLYLLKYDAADDRLLSALTQTKDTGRVSSLRQARPASLDRPGHHRRQQGPQDRTHRF